MFIKNIVLGTLGMVFFPLSYFILENLNFVMWGVVWSGSLIFFYFTNVYVIGKRRTFFTKTSSWIILLSLAFPFSAPLTGIVNTILTYTGIIAFSIAWLMVLFEMFASGTFKGH